MEIFIYILFRKSVKEIQVSIKSDNYNRYFISRPIYIFNNISLSSSWNEKCFRQKWDTLLVAQLVVALRHKPEARGIDPRLCH
jgi:hypothetical protein